MSARVAPDVDRVTECVPLGSHRHPLTRRPSWAAGSWLPSSRRRPWCWSYAGAAQGRFVVRSGWRLYGPPGRYRSRAWRSSPTKTIRSGCRSARYRQQSHSSPRDRAANALLVAGEQASLSRVADSSAPAVRTATKPPPALNSSSAPRWLDAEPIDPIADLIQERDAALTEAESEKRKRKQAEGERRRLMHQLELSDAAVHELSRPTGNVTDL
jgi:hypothetical protein